MHLIRITQSCLACLLGAALSAGEPAAEFPSGTMRDPAFWPFASDSPWNTPLGRAALYAMPTSPLWSETLSLGVLINVSSYTHPIFFAAPTDPLRWFWEGGSRKRQARVPDGARSNDDLDGAMHVIDEERRYVTETLDARRRSDMGFDTAITWAIDLRSAGVYPTYQGACAYGGSTIAGVIRPGELRQGIRHALRLSLRPQVLNPTTANGAGHVWPANSHEDGYTGTGNLHMGSLLALDPALDPLVVGGPEGTPGWHLAKALQDYGAYVVDRGHLNLYAEPAASAEVAEISYATRLALAQGLRVVTDNGPANVGGAGIRRRAPAPPMMPVGQFGVAPLGLPDDGSAGGSAAASGQSGGSGGACGAGPVGLLLMLGGMLAACRGRRGPAAVGAAGTP